jgi:hypothetical protein
MVGDSLMTIPRLLFALATILALSVNAWCEEGHPEGSSEGTSVYDLSLNELVTQSLVRDLQSMRTECLAAAAAYRLDCLRQGLELTSRRVPFHGEYGPIRIVFQSAAAALGSLITSSANSNLNRQVVPPDTNPRFKTRRYYTAVADYNDIKTKAYVILDQKQSQILKLATRSPAANKNFTAIAISFATLTDALRR